MELKIFSGQASKELTEKICQYLGIDAGITEVIKFSDGEMEVRFGENIRGADVYIVQSTHPPADNLMELLLWLDAAKRATAASITAVIPYFGWARQDRKAKSRVSISARLVADLISTAGANHVLTIDLHSAQIQGFFNISVDHLYTRPVFINFFRKNFELENFVVMGPDVGAAKIAESYAQRLGGRPVALAYKSRFASNQTKVLHIVGDVEDKNVLIVDDIIDTAGTIISVAKKLKDMGVKEIYAFCAHGILSGKAVSRVENSSLSRLFITDSILQEKESHKIEVISIAPLLAEAIKRSHRNESISSLFE